MNRREFLKIAGGLFISMPVLLKITGCGKNDYGSSSTSSDSTGFQAVSSVDSGHSHSIKILFADLANPPSGGMVYTSSSSGHTHNVSLTLQMLTEVNSGTSLTVVSSVDSGHSHTWVINKP